jgi:hypothetical protein
VADFPADEFRLDGGPGGIRSSAARWTAFGNEATVAASQIRSLDTSLFIGPEGDQYRQGLNDELPPHLDVTGQAYSKVGTALDSYATALAGLQDRMRPLAARAPGLWQALQAAQGRVSSAQAADQRHDAQVRANALTRPTDETPPPDTYRSDTGAATANLSAAQQAWNDCLNAARQVKTDLGTAIDQATRAIHDAADMRFKHNPHGFGALVAGVKDFVKDHVAGLAKLSGVLKMVSGIAAVLSFIPVIGEVALAVSLATAGAALLIDASIKLATGRGSWTSIAIDGALLAVPFGLGKGIAAVKGTRAAESAAMDMAVLRGDAAELVTGGRAVRPRDLSKWDQWAEREYENIRGLDDVDQIAEHVAGYPLEDGSLLSRDDVAGIKDHLFNREHTMVTHDGDVRHARFDADPDIAEAWSRLQGGESTELDRLLLQHELAESRFLEANPGSTYNAAHDYANSVANWQQAMRDSVKGVP